MKRILYLSYYFEPDLSAGSFRNTAIAKELARSLEGRAVVEVVTTQPNRYKAFQEKASENEVKDNLIIHRIQVPPHKSGMKDQASSYITYFRAVKKIARNKQYDLVFASSSRLFTAYLASTIANSKKCPLYLDIRDIFVDTLKDVIKNPYMRTPLLLALSRVEKNTFKKAIHINLVSEGFREYFSKFNQANFTFFPNGIDDAFLNFRQSADITDIPINITYAGNIGEGQGLEKIIPQIAMELGLQFMFTVIGDGGTKKLLEAEVEKHDLKNVKIIPPVKRDELIRYYQHSHFLFLHLNDYPAFLKVLPSKIFEYASSNIPLLAGVGGYAASFLHKNVTNALVFEPGDLKQATDLLRNFDYKLAERPEFIAAYSRSAITKDLVKSITSYL